MNFSRSPYSARGILSTVIGPLNDRPRSELSFQYADGTRSPSGGKAPHFVLDIMYDIIILCMIYGYGPRYENGAFEHTVSPPVRTTRKEEAP